MKNKSYYSILLMLKLRKFPLFFYLNALNFRVLFNLKIKDFVVEKLYELSKNPYQKLFKKRTPWNISQSELLEFPDGSIGHSLGYFLQKNQFEIQAKLEDHNVFHVLTDTGVSVVEEIGMQFYLFGNGKRSLYLYFVISTGLILYPAKITYFINEYKRGKKAFPFYDLDYSRLLSISVRFFKEAFLIS